MNRDNGALIGFYNTSYVTPTTNWTDFSEPNDGDDFGYNDDDGDEDDGQLIVDSS